MIYENNGKTKEYKLPFCPFYLHKKLTETDLFSVDIKKQELYNMLDI